MTAETTTAFDTSAITLIKWVADSIRKNGLEQTFGVYLKRGNSVTPETPYGEAVAACALGQAAINMGGEYTDNPDYLHRKLNTLTPMSGDWFTCHLKYYDNATCGDTIPLGNMITHMNDNHRQTFEQIADYLEGLVS